MIRAAVACLAVGLAGCASGAHQEPPSNTATTAPPTPVPTPTPTPTSK